MQLSLEIQSIDSFPMNLVNLKLKRGLQIALYDHVGISNKIRANPIQYGLTNVNDACQSVYLPSGNRSVCSTLDNYYFWDKIHPTGRTHEIIGKDMASNDKLINKNYKELWAVLLSTQSTRE